MEMEKGRSEERWLRRFRMLWALVILSPFLGIVAVIGSQTNVTYMLFPPLAAIGYMLFLDPFNERVTVRGIMAGPVIGAAIGSLALAWLPAGPLLILVVTVLGILSLYWLDSAMAPTLAVTLLSLPVGVRDGPLYVVAVAVGTSALAVIFFAWRRYVYVRAITPPPEVDADASGTEPQAATP